MFEVITNVIIEKDLTDKLKKDLQELSNKVILCGIPDSTKHKDSDLSNAQILFLNENGVRTSNCRKEMQHDVDQYGYKKAYEMYLHEHGSLLYNIPPRPVLVPAAEKYSEQISRKMKKCLTEALKGRPYETEMKKTAMYIQNVTRKFFTDPDNNWAPNAESTIKKKGSSRPLIDSSEMRKSITAFVSDRRE